MSAEVEWVRFPHDFEEGPTGLPRCRKCGYAPVTIQEELEMAPLRGKLVCFEQNLAGERRRS